MAAAADDLYVDGASIATGSPGRHVCTLGAGLHVPDGGRSYNACPCDGGAACAPLGEPGELHVVLDRPASGPREVRRMQGQSDDPLAVTELRLWVR